MPLQKPHPQGPPAPADQHSLKRQQLQQRRRTLHTISELSSTDGLNPDFSSFIALKQKELRSQAHAPVVKANVRDASKRRSLPQHCSSPKYLQAQASVAELAKQASVPGRSQRTSADMSIYGEGWNARRERARIQREQAVAGTATRHQPLRYRSQEGGNYPPLPGNSSPPSQSQLKSYSSHHQLLNNSHSISGISSSSSSTTLDRRSSLGTTIGSHSDPRSLDTESSSPDSSSYHPTRDSTSRRSRSGSSSNVSFTSQVVPAMRTSPPVMQRYYSSPASYAQGNAAAAGRSNTMGYAGPGSNMRTSSLPTIRIERVDERGHVENRQRISHASPMSAQQRHQVDVQKARLESLAALTALHPDSAADRWTPAPDTTNSRRASVPSQRSQYRTRSQSHLHPPPYNGRLQSSKTNSITSNNTIPGEARISRHEKRAVLKRESLTQWKAERDEAKAEFDGVQRAIIKERVRRANELEQEREEELLEQGKGVVGGKEKTKERGCFGGFWGMFRLGGSSCV